jgi:hypothetical protein
VDSFLPLIRLKHEELRWREEQRKAFDRIKDYLMSPLVLKVPRGNKGFKLYIVAQEKVIDTVFSQDDGRKESVVAYMSRHLMDAETRYTFMKKLCLPLYYACTKCRHYLLAGSCTVVSQHDAMRSMLHKPILSGRLGKWA